MATDAKPAELNNAEENNTGTSPFPVSSADEPPTGDEARLLHGVLRFLPFSAVKGLISDDGVCSRCILRLIGKYGPSCSSNAGGISSDPCKESEGLSANGGLNGSHLSGGLLNEPDICCMCCGILQFRYIDGNKMLVKHRSTYDFTSSVCEMVKQEGHQVDGFSLEVSIPSFILESENRIRLLLEKKYGSDAWFQENHQSEILSMKDAFKFSIRNALEMILGVKYGSSSFRINLAFTCSEATAKNRKGMDKDHASKRRKTGPDSSEEGVQIPLSSKENPILMNGVCLLKCSMQNASESDNTSYVKGLPCCLEVRPYRMPVFIGGRYLKYSRNVSQTRWIIGEERKGEASVEEIVGGTILPICKADNYKFHAAGREDIDVRMLGSGRPFLIELQNARFIPSEVHVKEMEERINSMDNRLVKVKRLKLVDNEGWALMREGEAEKQKEYAALVWISRPLEDEDFCNLSSLKDLKIIQRTPIRVLHRRSPLDREKIIHWMTIEKIAGSSQYFLLRLCTQAGTYIKEFVHGDLGRTHPSIGSIFGCKAEILQLDVTDVKMDCF